MKKSLLPLFNYLRFISPLLLLLASDLVFADPCKTCTKELAAPKVCARCGVATYCDKTCQTSDWPTHKSECKLLEPSKSLKDKTRIAPSLLEGAGMGLFATQDLPKLSFVAGYYGKIVEASFQSKLLYGSHAYLQPFVGKNYFLLGTSKAPAPHLAAQLANDPYVSPEDVHLLKSVPCSKISKEYLADIKAFSKKYMEEWISDQLIMHGKKIGISKANLDLEEAKDASHYPRMIARRDIMKDEELYYDYGLGYWLGIPVSICNKKGFSLAGTRIERAFSEVLEEEQAKQPALYTLLKEITASYITETQYAEEEFIIDDHAPLQFLRLFGSPDFAFIELTENPATLAIMEFNPLPALIDDLSELPNSDFIDDTYYGKPHPKSIAALKHYIEFLTAEGLSDLKVIEDPNSGQTFSWPEILKLIE